MTERDLTAASKFRPSPDEGKAPTDGGIKQSTPERGDGRVSLGERLSRCDICERPFPEPVPEAQARYEWGDAADFEIAYVCNGCADREGIE